MKRTIVETEIRTIIEEQMGVEPDQITSTTNIIKDLGADSLDQVELVMAVEDKYDIDIPDEEAEKLVTFADIVDYVIRNTN